MNDRSTERASPWTVDGVEITEDALAAIDRDACARYETDQEACGYATGPADDALLCDTVVALENLANKLHKLDPETYFRTAREFFAFNEKKFDDAVRAGEAARQPVKVLYHSHVDAGAYFSATDAAILSSGEPPATEGGPSKLGAGPAWPLAFLVCAVRGGASSPRVEDRRVYVWRGDRFEERALRIRSKTAGEAPAT